MEATVWQVIVSISLQRWWREWTTHFKLNSNVPIRIIISCDRRLKSIKWNMACNQRLFLFTICTLQLVSKIQIFFVPPALLWKLAFVDTPDWTTFRFVCTIQKKNVKKIKKTINKIEKRPRGLLGRNDLPPLIQQGGTKPSGLLVAVVSHLSA